MLEAKKVFWCCLSVLLISVALPMCGPDEQQEGFEEEQQEALTDTSRSTQRSPSKQVRTSNAPELIVIPVNVRERSSSADTLQLSANATLFTISLAGCDSNFTSTADESSTDLQVYKFDTGCLAKLTTFTFNGSTYVPTAADPFTTWETGDEAVFEVAADPSDSLRVAVVSTLDDPVVGTETVVYEFSEITKGSDEVIADTTVGTGHSHSVAGHASPSFTIDAVTFEGMSSGAGQFQFTLECTVALSGDLCVDIDLSDIRYKLIEDTPAYASTLSYAQAQALFPAGEQSIDLLTEKLAANQGGTVNGGFVTKVLTGPATIHSKPNMLLVIEAADLSYLYFNVDVTILTQD